MGSITFLKVSEPILIQNKTMWDFTKGTKTVLIPDGFRISRFFNKAFMAIKLEPFFFIYMYL